MILLHISLLMTGRFQRSLLQAVDLSKAYRVWLLSRPMKGKDRIDKAAATVGWVMRLLSVRGRARLAIYADWIRYREHWPL